MKKVVSILLVAAFMLGMTTTAFAATVKIKEAVQPISYNNANFDVEEVSPKKELTFALTADMFEWSDGSVGKKGAAVTRSQVSAASLKAEIPSRYTSNVANVIESVKIESTTKSSKVVIKFAETYTGTKPKKFDFTVCLYVGRQRQAESEIRLTGSFGNREIEVYGDDTYVDLSDGSVAKAMEYVRDIDVSLGKDVYMNTKMLKGKKYSGSVNDDVTEKDIPFLDKNDHIRSILRLNVSGLDTTGKVSFEFDEEYYVYNASGKYLGTTSDTVAFSTVYYLTEEKGAINGLSGKNVDSSSSSTSSSGDVDEPTNEPATSKPAATTSGSAISVSTATSEATSAVQNAGAASTVNVRFKDAASLSPEAFAAIHSVGSKSGRTMYVLADTMNDKAVTGRIAFKTTSKAPASTISLGARVDSKSIKTAKDKFSGWFKNDIAVVTLSQKGSFGISVEVAAKANLSGMDTSNLKFYAYDRSSNTYRTLEKPGYFVDTNNYLHFYTTYGGDIIISDGTLAKK